MTNNRAYGVMCVALLVLTGYVIGAQVERRAAKSASQRELAATTCKSERTATFVDRWYPPAPEGFYFCSLGAFRQ